MWKWEADNAKGVFVLVHGSGEHHGRYKWLIEQWRENGFHVVMGDLPGHGEGAKTRGHIDSFDEYIETIADWIKEAEDYDLPIFLFGHSLGGLAVIRTLTEKKLPVHAVILSSPCTGLVKPPPKPVKIFAKVVNSIAPKWRVQIKKSGANPSATRNKERLKKDSEDPLILRKVSIRWYNQLEIALKAAFDQIDDFPDIPLLVMQAGEDKIVDKHDVGHWFNKVPVRDKTYKEWEGLFHEVFNEPEQKEVFGYALGFVELHLMVHQER
ncbi:MAG TPA: alpha/beta hydrolase [Bacillales bacterium]|nr:alpha/beta hydrolase [Bacillales bacterium]